MTSWTVAAEQFDSPVALGLRRAYYAEVAGRYWQRPATSEEVDAGLSGDGAELLTARTGHFIVGRYAGVAAACGGFVTLDDGRAELTRGYVRPDRRSTGGGRLLLAALEEAVARGAREMVLNTRLDLVEARSLYLRQGYAEIPAYCTGPYREVWYGKQLAARVVTDRGPCQNAPHDL